MVTRWLAAFELVSIWTNTPDDIMEAGLYLHIPFCTSKCHYCDFYSVTALSRKGEIVEAMVKELQTETGFMGSSKPALRTIYFGGGTPSLLQAEDFTRLFNAIKASYDLSSLEEVTLEANPDDLSPEYLAMLRQFPFNRLSIGVQTLDDAGLKRINRRHTAAQAKQAVLDSRAAGFTNISIDLMYGLPGQTAELFRQTVNEALALPVTHVSSYALSWEEGSVLYKELKQGRLQQAPDELLEAAYFELNAVLAAHGFQRYELSNFAKPGYESKHNSSYWNGTSYLGIGPGAHSYNGVLRRFNLPSIDQYLEGMRRGEPARELEWLDSNARYNDFIMTSLRTSKGILVKELEKLFGVSKRYYCLYNARKNLKNGFLVYEDESLRLDEKGLFIADDICSDLIWV